MKHEIGKFVEAKSGSLTNWYEGQIVGYDDTNGVYVLHMCEKYPFTRYAGFSEDRIREVSEPTVIHVVLNSSPLGDLNHMREKMGREPLNEIDTEQLEQNIEAKAEELFYIFHTGDDTRSWERLVDKSGFRAIARHLATPQSDVQHALQAALESERELMDILRKIGKVFGKNVGTDIGILDLPKLVEENRVTTSQQQRSDAWSTLCELFPEYLINNAGTGEECMVKYINTLRQEVAVLDLLKQKVTEYLKTSYAFTGDVGVHPESCKLMIEVAEMTGVKLRHLNSKGAGSKPGSDVHDQLSFHKQNSKQIVRLNSWLQEHNLTKPGVCVTDTIIELLEKAVSPERVQTLSPRLVSDLQLLLGVRVKTSIDGTSDQGFELVDKLMSEYTKLCKQVSDLGQSIPHELR